MSATTLSKQQVFDLIASIPDPEIPVITIQELGILKDVELKGDGSVLVKITPTYSGCPAMKMIEDQIREAIEAKGVENVTVKSELYPPWTTDWLSDEAKQKLEDYGIAPPEKSSRDKSLLSREGPKKVRCPRCKSENTELVSQFGSTACKAHYKCKDCKEPFDYFKCI